MPAREIILHDDVKLARIIFQQPFPKSVMRERAPNHAATVPEIIASKQARESGGGPQGTAVRGLDKLHFMIKHT